MLIYNMLSAGITLALPLTIAVAIVFIIALILITVIWGRRPGVTPIFQLCEF